MVKFIVSLFGDSLNEVKKFIRTNPPEPISLVSKETGDEVDFLPMFSKDLDEAYETLVLIGIKTLEVN